MSNGLIYVVGEDHPEDVFSKAITSIDENLLTRDKLQEWNSSEQIPLLDDYQRVISKYFSRVEDKGKTYLDGTKEIKFHEEAERVFWGEMLKSVGNLNVLDSSLVEKVMPSLMRSKDLFSRKKQLIKRYKPQIIYHEGIGTKGGRDLVFGLHSIAHLAGEQVGSRVVYLDEGFAPYSDPNLSFWASQEGREEYWVNRISENKPKDKSIAFVGSSHIIGERSGIPSIGRFLDLLEQEGINFERLGNLE